MTHCADRTPGELSGGEQQRIALATALANRPRVLLADEPTGELDTAAAASVFDALQTANAELGVTILLVSHDPAVAERVRRTVAIRDGRTSTELLRHDTTDEAGNAATSAVEYAVMDRAGRVQLPREMTRPLGMRERVRLESTPDHIGVWPDRVRDPDAARVAGGGRAAGFYAAEPAAVAVPRRPQPRQCGHGSGRRCRPATQWWRRQTSRVRSEQEILRFKRCAESPSPSQQASSPCSTAGRGPERPRC